MKGVSVLFLLVVWCCCQEINNLEECYNPQFPVTEKSGCSCGGMSREREQSEEEEEQIFQRTTLSPEELNFEMKLIPGGPFEMGSATIYFYEDNEHPVRTIDVPSFLISSTETSNEQFAHFIEETGYKTDAEKYGWTFGFVPFISEEVSSKVDQQVAAAPWFIPIPGDWRTPEGPDSNITKKMDHPVVHVSQRDAAAFCEWAGMRLPSEEEWEKAARGGLKQRTYCWGNKEMVKGQYMVNTFQDDSNFPFDDQGLDGYIGTAPVRSFPPNKFGLHNMCGNVWEWTTTLFSSPPTSSPSEEEGDEEREKEGEKAGDIVVTQKGGSFLCTPYRCFRYRPAARVGNTADSSSANLGFRCAMDIK